MNLQRLSLAATLCTLLSMPALAVNYPTELRFSVGDAVAGPPEVGIFFNNNEGDQVRFTLEINANGTPLNWKIFPHLLKCLGTYHGGDPDSCMGLPDAPNQEWSFSKGFRGATLQPAGGIAMDTEYCFRGKATDTRGKESPWSQWVCARTPPMPGAPDVKFSGLTATLIPAVDGRHKVGDGSPAQMLLEWNAQAGSRGWAGVYVGERTTPYDSTWKEIARVKTSVSELTQTLTTSSETPTAGYPFHYRVCAVSWTGKTCSPSVQYPKIALNEKVSDRPAAAVLAPSTPNVALTAKAGTVGLALFKPTIVSPPAGAEVSAGQLILKIAPLAGSETKSAEAEFTWNTPRRNSPGSVTAAAPSATTMVFKTSMRALLDGVAVPAGSGPAATGVWTVRVRSVSQAAADPWSDSLSFNFVAPVLDARLKSAVSTPMAAAPRVSPAPTTPIAGWGGATAAPTSALAGRGATPIANGASSPGRATSTFAQPQWGTPAPSSFGSTGR